MMHSLWFHIPISARYIILLGGIDVVLWQALRSYPAYPPKRLEIWGDEIANYVVYNYVVYSIYISISIKIQKIKTSIPNPTPSLSVLRFSPDIHKYLPQQHNDPIS